MRYITGIALSLMALPALAQQQPASPPQTKAEAEVNRTWGQNAADLTAEAEDLRARQQLDKRGTADWARDELELAHLQLHQSDAQAALKAVDAFMAEQRQKLADLAKDSQDKLSASQKDRQTLAAQIASLSKQLAEAKKPDPAATAKIAQLGAELARARTECGTSSSQIKNGIINAPYRLPSSGLPHSTPAPGRK